jgi:predicted ATPase
VRQAANREAIGHFRQALALNEQRPRDLDCARTELAILFQLGPALMTVHGWPAPEVGVAFERAVEVARELESSVDLAPPLVGLFVFHFARGQFARAEEIVGELFTIARNVDDQNILLQAHHTAWPIRWLRGLHPDAIGHVDAGLNLYHEVRHARHRFLYMGHDPAVCALSIGAVLRWLLGYPEQAQRTEREAIALARRLQHAPSLAHALWFVGEAQIARRDVAAAMTTAAELLTLSGEQGLPQSRAIALLFLGWAMGQTGNIDEGLTYLEQGLAAWHALGARNYLTRAICLLAETYLKVRRYVDANEQLDLAVAVCSELGERWYLPRVHMLHAHLMVQQSRPDLDRAEASLRMAIDVAQAQSAKGWELRATNSLTRLWRDQGKRQQAHDLLAPVYGWFTEGFDTLDLKEAKALLEQLAA